MSEEPAIGHNGGPLVDWRDYGGFIVEARDSRDHPIIGYGRSVKPADPDRGSYSCNEAWRDLLHECRYQDGYLMNGGQKMLVRRGELIGAVSFLAHRWNWTPKTVRVFLDKLEGDGMIARFRFDDTERYKGNRNGNQANVLRVCNYDKFNTPQAARQQSQGQSSGNQGAIEGPHNKEEQRNKGTIPPPIPAPPVAKARVDECLPGEVQVGPSLFVNCETVRHRAFTLSIPGIAMQLVLANLGFNKADADKHAKDAAVAHALQWAAEIDGGKLPRDVIPTNPANFIRGSIVSQRNKQTAANRSGKPKLSRW
jgi:hypothetical protein